MGLSRRGLLTGLGALIAAPAIVRAASIMPVRAAPLLIIPPPVAPYNGKYLVYWHSSDWRDLTSTMEEAEEHIRKLTAIPGELRGMTIRS
jgi:hypothetical protein